MNNADLLVLSTFQDLRELFSLPKDGGFDISNTQKQLNEEHDHEHKM